MMRTTLESSAISTSVCAGLLGPRGSAAARSAARVFNLVAQRRCIEGQAGGGHPLGAGGFQFLGQQTVFVTGDALRLRLGERALHDGIGVQGRDQGLAQGGQRQTATRLLDARQRLVVQLLVEPHQTVGE
ncbi:MAG TPA: hypothetical protein PLO41_11335 [Rubrivivax sp.]|nr:hypothetical protein [Rubrivivax sp.]